MSLRHIAPGKLLDACRYWYPDPQRLRKLVLAACGYTRLLPQFEQYSEAQIERTIARLEGSAEAVLSSPQAERRWRTEYGSGATADKFAYDALWSFGAPNVPNDEWGERLNGITLCVFGELTEDESRKSPEVDRFDLKWRTEAVIGLAAKAYDERAFGVLPILADALEEAGCDNLPMLVHCREAGVHTRGCWVLDHILGKG